MTTRVRKHSGVWTHDSMNITAPSEIKEEFDYKPFSENDSVQKTITFFNNQTDSFSTNSNQELVGGRKQEWKNIVQKRSQPYVKHPQPKHGAGMVNKTYDIKRKLDIERLTNPYLLHPEDYETQQELFNAIKHWWIFKYRKKESTIYFYNLLVN